MNVEVKNKYKPRLKEKYEKEIIPALMAKFSYKNIMEVPKVEKVIVHVTLGEAIQNIKLLDAAEKQIALITGQKPLIAKSKRALAAFKLKKGMPIGCKVTLRKERMYEFLDKLISLALPRIRDFRGISPKSFDGRGNYSFGIKEQFIFPEIDYDKVEMIHGLDITICTTAKTDEEALALLKEFGMPYRK
ncbi:50S ribosomal protein L5 [Thermodesulfovibrio thiophilus]|uniref:50S ribosomal protein L5 n=1 Tax=Thermodesulfovibrio thiophilus TaxID=340095 RepID=UPI00040E9B4E|nr:50S ribosomal protein L5 [Thermodesulfovibrio thiophilus]